jgi:hypothetical protein
MHDAADDAGWRHVRLDVAARVDGVQPGAGQGPAEILQEPPRYAVHGRHHDGVCVQQGRDLQCHGAHRRRLDRDDHQILRAQRRGRVAGLDRVDLDRRCIRWTAVQLQAIALQRGQCLATRQHGHLAASPCQAGGKPAANRASAHDADLVKGGIHRLGAIGRFHRR